MKKVPPRARRVPAPAAKRDKPPSKIHTTAKERDFRFRQGTAKAVPAAGIARKDPRPVEADIAGIRKPAQAAVPPPAVQPCHDTTR